MSWTSETTDISSGIQWLWEALLRSITAKGNLWVRNVESRPRLSFLIPGKSEKIGEGELIEEKGTCRGSNN